MKGSKKGFISEKRKNKLKDREKLKKAFAHGKTLQSILAVPDSLLEELYRDGWLLLEHKRENVALEVFLFLLTLNPYQREYWLALSFIASRLGEKALAKESLTLASLWGDNQDIPYLFLAQKLFEEGGKKNLLEACKILCKIEEYPSFKKEVSAIKKILNAA